MRRFKNIALVMVFIIFAISFFGCNNSSATFSGSKTGNDTQFLVDFQVLNTTVDKEMSLSIGDSIDTSIDIKEGKVDILVKNENGTIIYRGDDVQNGHFTLGINETDDYAFYITGYKAKGSVHFIKVSGDITTMPTDPAEDSVIENTPAVLPVIMPTPPFSYFYSATSDGNDTRKPILLNMTSCEPNDITDVDRWFTDNEISLSLNQDSNYFYEFEGTGGIDDNVLKIYNATQDQLLYTIDFSEYAYAPEYKEEDYYFIQQKIKWVTIVDDVLYVSHGHRTYAKSSNNMNAYITAINLSDMSVIWRSDALVCNSNNFLIINDIIISGYGFTDESDFLYQIDRKTGKTIEKTPLKTAPEYIIRKDSTLYVRTYNTDYQFTIE